jgi:PAS domain S-box-containing protein
MHSNPKKDTTKSGELKDSTKEQIGDRQSLLDSYPGSMFSVDRNYCYIAFNGRHKEIMLATYGASIEIGHNLLEYMTVQKDREAAKQNLDRALAGEHFTESAYSVEALGKESFFDIRHTPIKDENGVSTGVSVFSENVTELVKSKNAYNKTENLYINIFMEISSIILIIDVETKSILNANQAACTFYGYTHSELTSLKISDLAALSAEELHSRIQKVTNGEANHFQSTHRLANGEIREVDIYAGEVKFNDRQVNVAVIHDVSERKIAEERLREILENLQYASYRRNLKTERYDYISPVIAQMSGFTSEEIIAMTTEAVLRLMHTDDLAAIEQAMNTSTANPGNSYQIEYRFKNKLTGQYHWFQDRFTTTLDEQGHPAFRYGNVRDITNQKTAEEEKKEAEFRYRSLFEQSHDAIFILDLQGAHLAVNQRAADMMGYAIEEMRGLSFNETSAEVLKSREVIQQLLNGEHIPLYERLFKKKDGTAFPVEINVELIRDSHGNPLHIQSVIRDISERKIAEEELRESEEKYRSFVENSFDAITFVDEMGNITEWNRTAENLTGLKKENVIGRPYWEIQIQLTLPEYQTPEHIEEIKTNMLGMLQTGYSPLFNRVNSAELIKADGTRRIVEQISFSVKKRNGYGVRSVARDVTARKQAEEKLRESEENYRTFVEQSFDAITFVNEQGNVTEWNLAAEKLTGLKKEDVLGRPYWETHLQLTTRERKTPEYVERFKKDMFETIQTGQSTFFNHLFTGELIRTDGVKRIVDQIIFPVKTKNGYGIRSLARDITERNQAEEKLHESEERFRLLFENSQAVMGIIDPESGEILDANPAAANFYGYSLEQLRGMSIDKINTLPPETVYTERQHALREERNFFVFPHRLASGELRIVEVHSSPIQMKGRQVLFSIIHDVTKRKLAEEKLIESEERFSTAFHSSQEAISITRVSDGVYIDINDAFCSVFELSRGQVIGRTSKELNLWVNPEERDELFKIIHEKGQVPNFEKQFRTKTGRIGFMQASMGRTTIAGEECILIFGRDITASKLAEEKLRESEENYRTFVEQGFDGIMFVDNQGIIVEWNRAIEGLTGLNKENVLGKAYWDVRFQLTPAELRTPETLLRFKENTFEMLQPGQSNFLNRLSEGEMVTTSGERKMIEQIAFRVITKNGYGIRSVTRDITDRKKAEAELRAAHEELEQRVRERTLELQTALSSLQRVASVKDEFLASMGHELRTPLNIILGSAQLLQESVYGGLNEKQSKAVTSIEDGGEKLLKLISDILDLTKLQSGELAVTMSPTLLENICRSILNLTASSAKNKQLQVDFSMTPNEIMLRTDELRVQQVLLILFDNAIKFTPSGGKVGIDVIGSQKNKHIKITVWDTGIGINPDNLSRLFQPFTQLDARLSREYEGSGLGLALAQQLVELFGGSISVESALGEGSRFTVTLPWME